MSRTVSPACHLSLTLASPDATADFARGIAQTLRAGDVLLLSGEIGAGKTHFARALIQSILTTAEDVPSPTYTLVQSYDTTRGALWHADLYRLSDPDEAVELGLSDAFEEAICLIEWPERLQDLRPAGALHLAFAATDPDDTERRELRLTSDDPRWAARLKGLGV